ncbi:DUF2786 domain-containing protein [Mycolicibacterium neoaurum]|nr:DUF2786 domain-containing protein [Mycolicibacterium neoaurum]WBP97144.1 DUF2786 domain-containing protein [Mycolicibacterium neoaurum]WBS10867.1 DUF2786 domain-containing protein [Mycolicibacterium neoaurum]
MSRHNRQKRAAKQKARRRASSHHKHCDPDPHHDRVALLEHLVAALQAAARCPEHDAGFHAAEIHDEYSHRHHDLDAAADVAMIGALIRAWEGGWSPNDLHEISRRRLDGATTDYLREAIVRESHRYAVTTLHPRWRTELVTLSAGISTSTYAPQMSVWADRRGVSNRAALTTMLNLLQFLGRLPVLEQVQPMPGTIRYSVPQVDEADAKMLARGRGLLAKAEATQFPEEAEALSAKAQELMSRYSLHQAIGDHDAGRQAEATARRLWLDNPYAGAKASLVQTVAAANRCRVVWAEKLGFATIIGAEADLDLVELLTTSLLVQANRAMLSAGRLTTGGQTRTRSFRQSFLISYAIRIGERLTAVSTSVTTEVDRDKLLPVLAARSKATEDLTNRLFPAQVARAVSASNYTGVAAGRAAADLAELEVRRPIAG